MKIVAPELLWIDGRFQRGVQLEVGDDGTIARVGASLGDPDEKLDRRALLPGMVNAHSHAFQRGLRGKAETFAEGSGTFWSWRDAMYDLANALDADRFERLTRFAFQEMLGAGITTVGEFHYVHHLSAGRGYELDHALVDAGADTGIRLVVLDACYTSGDVGQPLADQQKRFGSSTVEAFLQSAERLRASLHRRQSLGLVAHSVRAVPIDGIAELHEAARARGLVFHMHVEEQVKEIEAVRAEHGQSPLALLLDRLEIGEEFTAVHCTHSDADELRGLLRTGANVCLCPLTEANLADGIAPAMLAEHGDQLSLGTDSNLRIDFAEEMRLLEYGQRLRDERRGVFTAAGGSVAERLFQIATEGGARALGVKAGRLVQGYPADYFTLDLDAPSLRETADADLLTAWVFGCDTSAIDETAVAGAWIR